jgi:hypothetical protein
MDRAGENFPLLAISYRKEKEMISKNTMKRLGLTVVLTMFFGLFGATLAQSAEYTDTLNGIEISPGIADEDKEVRYGVAFAGKASGPLPGYFAAAVNYTSSSPGPNITNVIIGGSWAVTVIKNGRFLGTVYGQVTDGMAVWDATGKVAAVQVNVIVKGGTKNYARVTGDGVFEGTLDHTPLARKRPPTLNGTLDLNF